MSDPRGRFRAMDKRSLTAVEAAKPQAPQGSDAQAPDARALQARVERLEQELERAQGEIAELLQELEEKAMALAASRVAETTAAMGAPAPAEGATDGGSGTADVTAQTPAEARARAKAETQEPPRAAAPAQAKEAPRAAAQAEAPEPAARQEAARPRRLTSLVRSALDQGANQSRMRIAFLEEELGRQAERHAQQIAEMEAHFVAKLAEVAGGGSAALVRALEERIVELERERADPAHLVEARATIGRLLAEQEDLRAENRYLSAEVERWAALAQDKQFSAESTRSGREPGDGEK